ncbi:MAG: cysteine-rich KTR domain-containing protein [Clostridiales bacterium]|nr:cysteine-rich KTR domain-containing protein [Clostridiales bacterium]MDU6975211.1 cysteine-rich KTR domain-containing protein [Clostridiales bacterium]
MPSTISEWLRCPVCGSKTRLQIREDTELKKFPLFCPKCKQETLINVKELNIMVIQEPDAKTQSR